MNRIIIITLLFGIFISGLSQKPDNYDEQLKSMYKNTVPLITQDELVNELEKNSNLVLLDAREMNEYKVSHLEGARYIGYDNFNKKTVKDIPKDASIVVYCSLGVRSEIIGEKLLEAGFSNVKNLYGGIFEWVYYDNTIIDKKGNETQNVHTFDKDWSKWLIKGEKVY